jgi:hypothetical protein
MAEGIGLNFNGIQGSSGIEFASDKSSGNENGKITVGITGKNIIFAYVRCKGGQYEEPEYFAVPFGITIQGNYYKIIVSSDAINIVRDVNGRWSYDVAWLYIK